MVTYNLCWLIREVTTSDHKQEEIAAKGCQTGHLEAYSACSGHPVNPDHITAGVKAVILEVEYVFITLLADKRI